MHCDSTENVRLILKELKHSPITSAKFRELCSPLLAADTSLQENESSKLWERFVELAERDPYTTHLQQFASSWVMSPWVQDWVQTTLQACKETSYEVNLALEERLADHLFLAAAVLRSEFLPTARSTRRFSIETSLVHCGEPEPRIEGAVSAPIFCSVNFESKRDREDQELGYLRLSRSPNHIALHEKLRDIEKGEAALVSASGMAAISTALLSQLQPNDHILVQEGVYGGTYTFITEELRKWGIEYTFVDTSQPASWQRAVQNSTKLFYLEAMSNPLTRIPALFEVVKFCRQYGLVSIIDNTFATPINFQPLTLGFDLVIHSATKYLNGHSDVLAGVIVGSSKLLENASALQIHLGATLDPHACFLLNRGLKTLHLRIPRQNSNALGLAVALEAHPLVKRVYYPGLNSHPDHTLARNTFKGFGGVLSFEPQVDIDEFLGRLSISTLAPSLGGVETLVTVPARTSHQGIPRSERERIGISDNLIRVSVGIESQNELIEDFLTAFSVDTQRKKA